MRCERLALSGDDAAGVAADIRKLVPPAGVGPRRGGADRRDGARGR